MFLSGADSLVKEKVQLCIGASSKAPYNANDHIKNYVTIFIASELYS